MTQPDDTLPPATLPEPLEVVLKIEDRLVAWACPKCGLLFILGARDTEKDRKRKMQDAAAHCVQNCVCGKPLDYHYYLRCKECRAAVEIEKEKARYDKAVKLVMEDYEGPVYWEGHEGGLGDGYFSGIDEVLDYCEDEGVSVPEYVWACTPHPFTLDAENILEHELERQEMYENAGEGITDDARKRLQAYLTVWAQEQHITGWQYDYTRAVLLRDGVHSSAEQVG
jgi:predicted RNA-binding Zn-ribbon protein involved in translation (DUF1610 family)